ncbi:HNH endonuclease [Nostoc sp. FACHB-87]|uniref:HNH endonuclease n=1 Tax=Nostocaceae TaxID=1162 RepID=UPI001686F541|nr:MULTISPECIES: HNH endonuclease [Nostocaceae]MBD2458413.1 HNH endonuclease [Nostoc sp. FACHB-87]MBD2479491.1 HNH endonuclease [Anabaena sp. FACHB-83]
MNNDITFNPDKFYLGRLCSKHHEWQGTGKSLRYKPSPNRRCGACVECHREESRNRGDYYKKHYQRNKQRVIQNVKQWRNKNKEKVKEIQDRYRRSEKGRRCLIKASNQRRAKKLMNHRFNYSCEQLSQVKESFFNQCAYCGSNKQIQIDHFIAVNNGGSDCIGNFVAACRKCNRDKSDSDPKEWYTKQPFYSIKRWRMILKILGKTESTYNQIPLL